MIGYKVVDGSTGFLYSSSRGFIKYQYVVKYLPGEWVKPNLTDSKLFFFKNLADAESFRKGDGNLQIWECEARDCRRTNPAFFFYNIVSLWTCLKEKKSIKTIERRKLSGSYAASSIKLISKVK